VKIDTSGWSGDGDFTVTLVKVLEGIPEIAAVRVEDAPASREGEGYNLLANEVFVSFRTAPRAERVWWLGLIPVTRHRDEPLLTLAGLEARLAREGEVGAPDYSDEGMLQYLRTQRVVAAYQTRGYKLVELVRIYASGAPGTLKDQPVERVLNRRSPPTDPGCSRRH
jgi:hypothetical protein